MTPWLFSEEKNRVKKTEIWKWDLHFIWNSICISLKPPCFNMDKIKIFWWAWWCYLEKERLKPQKDVAHVVILIEIHFYFTNRKRSASAGFTLLFVTRKRIAGSQSCNWPKRKSISWSHEWPSAAATMLTAAQPVPTRRLFRQSAPATAKDWGNRGIHFRALPCLGTHLKVTTPSLAVFPSWPPPPTVVL